VPAPRVRLRRVGHSTGTSVAKPDEVGRKVARLASKSAKV
jgi:hypothetical protein